MLFRLGAVLKILLKLPVLIYRYGFSPFIAAACRHQPSCSAYALEAIETNGSWKGFWLMVSRLLRCHPWGTHGLDPVPDLAHEHYPVWQAWKYGRWTQVQVDESRTHHLNCHCQDS